MWKHAIRNAVDEVYAIPFSNNVSCALVTVDATTFEAIRDPVLGIFSNHPEARYSFNISAGSKRLPLGLSSMSLWVEGETYTHSENPRHSVCRSSPFPRNTLQKAPTISCSSPVSS